MYRVIVKEWIYRAVCDWLCDIFFIADIFTKDDIFDLKFFWKHKCIKDVINVQFFV